MSLLKWDWIYFTEGGAKLAVLTAAEPYKYCFEIKLVKFEKDVWDFDHPEFWETRYLLTGTIWQGRSARLKQLKAWYYTLEDAQAAAEAVLVTMKLEGKI